MRIGEHTFERSRASGARADGPVNTAAQGEHLNRQAGLKGDRIHTVAHIEPKLGSGQRSCSGVPFRFSNNET